MEPQSHDRRCPIDAIEASVYAALEHYANVHRGSGHGSAVSTQLYEQARAIVLRQLGLGDDHVVIFCTPWRLPALLRQLPPRAKTRTLSSDDVGLAVGVRALAVRRTDLPRGAPAQPGGGTIRMVSEHSVNWADVPDRFEPGTPNITGVIAFARALQLSGGSRASLAPVAGDEVDQLAQLSGRPLLTALRAQLIGREVLVPTDAGPRRAVNFDNGASTPTFQPIWRAVRRAWRRDQAGRRRTVRQARASLHRFFGAPEDAYEAIFASSTTEAIAMAVAGLRHIARPGTVVLNTAIEHNSNELPWRSLPGVTLARMPVDREGFVDLGQLESVLCAHNQDKVYGERRIALLCVCGASNVMGSYNDLAAIAHLAHRFGAKLLVDAAQLAPHRRIRMAEDGIDLLAFSAHKMYAPFGSGSLLATRGLLRLPAVERQLATTSGEENLAGIAALGAAIDLLERIGMDVIEEEERALMRHALDRLTAIPGLKLYGVTDPAADRFARKGGVLCFELDGVPHNLLARRLAELGGIAVRSGCFCVNMYVKWLLGVGKVRNGLARAGLTVAPRTMERLLIGLVRVSFGITSQPAEVDHLAQTLTAILDEERGVSARLLARNHLGTPFLPTTSTTKRIDRLVERKARQVFDEAPRGPK